MKTAMIAAMSLCMAGIASSQSDKSEPMPVHIFVSDVSSHDVAVAAANGASGGSASGETWGSYSAYASSGNYPQMPEVAKAFATLCPAVALVTTVSSQADFLLIVSHERFQEYSKHNKVVLVDRSGIAVWGDATRELDNGIKDACRFLAMKPGGSLASAKTVYIDNQSEATKTAATASDELRKWGRFIVVKDREQADLVFLFTGREYEQHLAVKDPKTGATVWTGSAPKFTASNNETKNLIEEFRKAFGSGAAKE